MQTITQINGSNAGNNAHVARLFEQYNVQITHQHLEEFMIAPLQDVWERHEMVVDLLHNISICTFHTVVNVRGPITRDMAVQILQAMLTSRPIVLCELPDFSDDVDTYTQRLISSKLHHFSVTNLTKLDTARIRSVVRHLRVDMVDYALSSSDIILIRAEIRSYLRNLLTKPQVSLLPEAFLA